MKILLNIHVLAFLISISLTAFITGWIFLLSNQYYLTFDIIAGAILIIGFGYSLASYIRN